MHVFAHLTLLVLVILAVLDVYRNPVRRRGECTGLETAVLDLHHPDRTARWVASVTLISPLPLPAPAPEETQS